MVLVDCDGQANLTRFFAPCMDADMGEAITTADILTGNCEPLWRDNLLPVREEIQLLPGCSGLYDLDVDAIKDGVSAPENLRQFTAAARADDEMDFMIFDCPPATRLPVWQPCWRPTKW